MRRRNEIRHISSGSGLVEELFHQVAFVRVCAQVPAWRISTGGRVLVELEPNNLSVHYIKAAFEADCRSSTERLVLVALADNASHEGWCFPSLRYLQNKCHLTRPSVIKQIKALEARGLLVVNRDYHYNRYKLLLSVTVNPVNRVVNDVSKSVNNVSESGQRGIPKPSVTAIKPSIEPSAKVSNPRWAKLSRRYITQNELEQGHSINDEGWIVDKSGCPAF